MPTLLDILVSETGLSEHDVRYVAATAPSRYKVYEIPKRRGGTRTVSQPAKEVKFLQRIIVTQVLSKLPIHPAATAYRGGTSIRHNAAAHARSGAIAKFDFKDFFPSITAADWRTYCINNAVFEEHADIWLSSSILFSRSRHGAVLRLAVGAPSSPMLSNVIMYNFDQLISEAVSGDKVTYTRYADDMTFSAKRAHNLIDVESRIKLILRQIASPKLRLNDDKTTYVTRKFRRVVTGLVLTDDGNVSLGRGRKRNISAAVHRFSMGLLPADETARLSGLLAYANSVEPDFIDRLTRKYGAQTIGRIKSLVGSRPSEIAGDVPSL